MQLLAAARKLLAAHSIRDAEDFAEVLVAEAVDGKRVESGVTQGYDVVCAAYKRIEVKCRQLPLDGRIEERVSFNDSKADGFDYAAVVVFEADFTVKGAVLVPYASIWPIVAAHAYGRVSYVQARALPGAIDITTRVREAAAR